MGFQRVIERHFLDPRKLDKNSDQNGKNEALIEQNI